MTPYLWIALGVAVTAVVWYVLWLRVLFRRSRDADRQVDHTRLRPWKDDPGEN